MSTPNLSVGGGTVDDNNDIVAVVVVGVVVSATDARMRRRSGVWRTVQSIAPRSCAAAADINDVGTDGTNLAWHVWVLGGILNAGSWCWSFCYFCGWCHIWSSYDCVIFRGEDIRSSGDSNIAELYLVDISRTDGVRLPDLDAARYGERVLG